MTGSTTGSSPKSAGRGFWLRTSRMERKARGEVYYEAGIAYGLNIPVVFTCRQDKLDQVRVDARQYNHIVCNEPGDPNKALQHRILATIGDGRVLVSKPPNCNRRSTAEDNKPRENSMLNGRFPLAVASQLLPIE